MQLLLSKLEHGGKTVAAAVVEAIGQACPSACGACMQMFAVTICAEGVTRQRQHRCSCIGGSHRLGLSHAICLDMRGTTAALLRPVQMREDHDQEREQTYTAVLWWHRLVQI